MSFIPKRKLNVLQTFIDLTATTIPHGYEEIFAPLLQTYGAVRDSVGNWYINNRKSSTPVSTMFTCHLDTVSVGGTPLVFGTRRDRLHKIAHRSDGRFISTDGTTNLGADDKAGMCVMLSMLQQDVEGLYYFFIGEECGGIGSSRIADTMPQLFTGIQRCISFDRRGYNSIITNQFGGECASDKFADALSGQFARNKMFLDADTTGVFTDSANFTHLIPECTNISVGYFHEHTTRECQDMLFLETLCDVAPKIRWDDLPVSHSTEPEYAYYNDAHLFSGGTTSIQDMEDWLWAQYGTMPEAEWEALAMEIEERKYMEDERTERISIDRFMTDKELDEQITNHLNDIW